MRWRYLELSGLKGQGSQRAYGHVLRDQLNTACRLSENQLHKLQSCIGNELHWTLLLSGSHTNRADIQGKNEDDEKA